MASTVRRDVKGGETMTGQSTNRQLAEGQPRRLCVTISPELTASIHPQTRLFWD